jgi:hypothetical protein
VNVAEMSKEELNIIIENLDCMPQFEQDIYILFLRLLHDFR